ncbi:SHOCT domain-containing protein [Hymenobacter aerophilus]|uniref:SHOCT domain-containing protein n=1 Tax=Hymenobacter aerophilus TaxID=119644 RepID=UPI000371709A|nr:SHOCT domain-containing protein [Hymenobacter aerophilus]
MAKSIKALKCPQCGSTQKTQVRPEHFRCDNCGTEYFLDNDDININYTERKLGTPATPNRPGLIAGAELGKVFASQTESTTSAPPDADPVQQLQKLKLLLDEGILTPEEYAIKRRTWLDKL